MAKFARLFNLSENVQILLTKEKINNIHSINIRTDCFGLSSSLIKDFASKQEADTFLTNFSESDAKVVRTEFMQMLK